MRVTSRCFSRSRIAEAISTTCSGVLPEPKITSGKPFRNARCRSTWANGNSATGADWNRRSTASSSTAPFRKSSRSFFPSSGVTRRFCRWARLGKGNSTGEGRQRMPQGGTCEEKVTQRAPRGEAQGPQSLRGGTTKSSNGTDENEEEKWKVVTLSAPDFWEEMN